jgi:hypothetical protein
MAATAVHNTGIQDFQIRARIRTGADWFIWIGALSVINSIILTYGGNFHFIFGLGCTELVSAAAANLPAGGMAAGWVVNIILAGVFCVFGKFGRDAQKWAFYSGMLFYIVDAMLVFMFRDWLGLAFHAYALYRIYMGVKAIGDLDESSPAAMAAGAGTMA